MKHTFIGGVFGTAKAFPHAGGCEACSQAKKCNCCGGPLTRQNCTNGRCGPCHIVVCTSGGATKEGHGFGDPEAHKLSIFDTDSASPVRFEFIDSDAETIFSIGTDGAVTVNPDIELDDAGRAFWKAVKRTAPSSVKPVEATTDDDGELARVKVLPCCKDGKPLGYDMLFINGVAITSMSPGSDVGQHVRDAFKAVKS